MWECFSLATTRLSMTFYADYLETQEKLIRATNPLALRLIFECPDCGYVRHWNRKTQEIRLINKGNEYALHSGFYEPTGLQLNNMNPN